ncbi:MAG TPA: energy transducer TonB [Candidatus Acidoferrum sp.]|nr:energy transducer TonB [Candidatus Acidoferrum sp.]
MNIIALFIIVSSTFLSSASAQETNSFLPEAQIRATASRILIKADKANCKPHECKILVANFTFGSGLTSQLGVQLADQFSREFASQQSDIQVVDRPALRSYLEQERIPGALFDNEKAMRWLGKQLGGTAVLTGLIEDKASSMHVKLQMFSCDNEKARLEDELMLAPQAELKDVLTGVEAFPQKPTDDKASPDLAIPRAGVNGVTQPACIYCTSPHHTQAAQDARFNGSILLDVVLSEEGRVIQGNIVRGAPYGLNQQALQTVQNWKLKPATLNGKPVVAKVNIEMMFRLN